MLPTYLVNITVASLSSVAMLWERIMEVLEEWARGNASSNVKQFQSGIISEATSPSENKAKQTRTIQQPGPCYSWACAWCSALIPCPLPLLSASSSSHQNCLAMWGQHIMCMDRNFGLFVGKSISTLSE